MNCKRAQRDFSGYLDGIITGREMQAVSRHLDACTECREEFAAWRGLQAVLSRVGPAKAPADLGLKLRLALSHEVARRGTHRWNQLSARWENLVQPALLQFGAGLAGAVLLIGSIAMLIGAVAVPPAVQANDEPLGAVTAPHYLYSATGLQSVRTPEDTTIVVEASINAAGEVYDYTIISGPLDPTIETQVRNQLLVQVYEPARVFGGAVHGRVLITFAGVSVKA